MVVRLLVAVLMLAGPMPVRACTCAAATTPCVPAEPSARALSPDTPKAETKRCGCRSSSAADDTAPAALTESGRSAQADERDGHQHPERHDRDCPAVNPLPAASAAVLTPAADIPADSGLVATLFVETSWSVKVHCRLRLQPGPAATAVPLYISLLTLRN